MARRKTTKTTTPPAEATQEVAKAVETPPGPVVVVLSPLGFLGGAYQRPRLPDAPSVRIEPGEEAEVPHGLADYLVSTFPSQFTVKK